MATKYLDSAVEVLKRNAPRRMTAAELVSAAKESPQEFGWDPTWNKDANPGGSLRRGLLEAIAMGLGNEDIKSVKCSPNENEQPLFWYQPETQEAREIHAMIDRMLSLKRSFQKDKDVRIEASLYENLTALLMKLASL